MSTVCKKNTFYLDYVLLLKALGFASFKKGKIIEKDSNAISNLAAETINNVEAVLGTIGSRKDYIEKYFRAEINYMVNGSFYDPECKCETIQPLKKLSSAPILISPYIQDLIQGSSIDLHNAGDILGLGPNGRDSQYKCIEEGFYFCSKILDRFEHCSIKQTKIFIKNYGEMFASLRLILE